MFKLGLIVNPHAGLRDCTNVSIQSHENEAFRKVELVLSPLQTIAKPFQIITCSGDMGESVCRKMHLQHEIIYDCGKKSTALDTEIAVGKMMRLVVDLIIFFGGEGTGQDICKIVGNSIPIIGVCTTKNNRTSVFKHDPVLAGELIGRLLRRESVDYIEHEVIIYNDAATNIEPPLLRYMKTPVVPIAK